MSEAYSFQAPPLNLNTLEREREDALRNYLAKSKQPGDDVPTAEAYDFVRNELDDGIMAQLEGVDVDNLAQDEYNDLFQDIVDEMGRYRDDSEPGLTNAEWDRNLESRLDDSLAFLETSADCLATENDAREYAQLLDVIAAAHHVSDPKQKLEVVMEIAVAVRKFVFAHRTPQELDADTPQEVYDLQIEEDETAEMGADQPDSSPEVVIEQAVLTDQLVASQDFLTTVSDKITDSDTDEYEQLQQVIAAAHDVDDAEIKLTLVDEITTAVSKLVSRVSFQYLDTQQLASA